MTGVQTCALPIYMRWNARRLERKGYNLLNIAHLDGMPAEDHDLIEKRANEILERSRRIRLNSYRF